MAGWYVVEGLLDGLVGGCLCGGMVRSLVGG